MHIYTEFFSFFKDLLECESAFTKIQDFCNDYFDGDTEWTLIQQKIEGTNERVDYHLTLKVYKRMQAIERQEIQDALQEICPNNYDGWGELVPID